MLTVLLEYINLFHLNYNGNIYIYKANIKEKLPILDLILPYILKSINIST